MVAGYWLIENKPALQLEYSQKLTEDFTKEAKAPVAPKPPQQRPPAPGM
jgi:hypothetical protein